MNCTTLTRMENFSLDGRLSETMFTTSHLKEQPQLEKLLCRVQRIISRKMECFFKDGRMTELTLMIRVSKMCIRDRVYEADDDASYVKTIEIDLSSLEPTVSYPHLPENTHLAKEGKNIKIDQVVIGSCTNGRLEDMEAAYQILHGKKVAPDVRVIIIPATMAIYKECLRRGYTESFIDAGLSLIHICTKRYQDRI